MTAKTTQDLFKELRFCFKAMKVDGTVPVFDGLVVITNQIMEAQEVVEELERRLYAAVKKKAKERK